MSGHAHLYPIAPTLHSTTHTPLSLHSTLPYCTPYCHSIVLILHTVLFSVHHTASHGALRVIQLLWAETVFFRSEAELACLVMLISIPSLLHSLIQHYPNIIEFHDVMIVLAYILYVYSCVAVL